MDLVAADRQKFDLLLERVIGSLPTEVRKLLDEVPVIVEDEPSQDVLDEVGIVLEPGEEPDLCGMHGGERIMIFRGPIYRLVEDDGDDVLAEEIRITLLHEIGHHFGMEEEDLAALGYD